MELVNIWIRYVHDRSDFDRFSDLDINIKIFEAKHATLKDTKRNIPLTGGIHLLQFTEVCLLNSYQT